MENEWDLYLQQGVKGLEYYILFFVPRVLWDVSRWDFDFKCKRNDKRLEITPLKNYKQ